MKELSIEQKAQRYDEAIEKAKSKIKDDKDHVLYEDDIIDIFPELAESEGERIRKKIIKLVKEHSVNHERCQMEVWLEKQGEQKPAEWSEEDVHKIDRLIMYFKGKDNKEFTDWFSLLKDRVVPQPKQEWSEEDETKLTMAQTFIRNTALIGNDGMKDATIDWLKSLRPQSQWKPSESHIFALESVIDSHPFANPRTKETLQDLVKQLKAL